MRKFFNLSLQIYFNILTVKRILPCSLSTLDFVVMRNFPFYVKNSEFRTRNFKTTYVKWIY